MNKTVLALATALLLAGGTADTAFAKSHGNNGHHERNVQAKSGHKHKYNGVRSDTHWDRSVVHDNDHDGIANHYDNFDNRWDRTRFRVSQPHVYMAVRPFSGPVYVAPAGYRYTRWSTGAYLPRGYYGDPYYVNYQTYALPPPPYGYRWNRVGNDVYLVQTRDGLIADVVLSLFH